MRIEMSFFLSPLYIPLFSLLCMALRFNNQWTAFFHDLLVGIIDSSLTRLLFTSPSNPPSCSLSLSVMLPTLRNMVRISTRSCLPSSCSSLFPFSDFSSAWSLLPPPYPGRSFLFFLVVFSPCSLSRVGRSFPLCLIAPSFLFCSASDFLPCVLHYNGFWCELLCIVLLLTNDISQDPCVALSLSARAN